MKRLLLCTAVIEAATGLVMVIRPSVVASVLLGSSLDAPVAVVVGRVAGAAVLTLGVACGLACNTGRGAAARGMVAAILVYNIVVTAVLTHAGVGWGLSGIGLWPAVALHVALTVWCLACLRPKRRSSFP